MAEPIAQRVVTSIAPPKALPPVKRENILISIGYSGKKTIWNLASPSVTYQFSAMPR